MFDIILNALINYGYTQKEGETIINNFLNEQRTLDEIQTILHNLIKKPSWESFVLLMKKIIF